MFIAFSCFDYCAPEECYVSCFSPIELGIDLAHNMALLRSAECSYRVL